MTITHRIIKSEFVYDRFQIVEPELRNKLSATARASRLGHLSGTLLVQLDTDRCRSLYDVKEFAERKIKERHDDGRLMRQGDEVIHVTVQPETGRSQHETRDRDGDKQHVWDEVECELLQRNADYVPAYLMFAQMLVKESRPEEAREVLDRGIAAASKAGNGHALSEMESLLSEL